MKDRLRKLAPKITINREMCKNGCYLFDPVNDASVKICPVCTTARSGKQLKMVSIGQKIAHLLTNPETREMLKNDSCNQDCMDSNNAEKSYTDIHDGETYKKLQSTQMKNEYDIGIILNVDGFTSNESSESMHIINCIVQNFDPSIRYS